MPSAQVTPEHIAAVQQLWYGHGNVPSRTDYEFAWKAIKAVAAGDGELSPQERLHLVGKMCAILTPPDIVETVLRFDERSETPERLLERIQVPAEVRAGTGAWVAYEGLGVAMADGDLAPAELEGVRRAAAAMGVPAGTVDALAAFCREEAALRARRIELLHSTIAATFRFAHDGAAQDTGGEPIAAQP